MGRVTIAQPSASFDAEGRVGQYIPRRQKSVKTSLAVTAGAPSTSDGDDGSASTGGGALRLLKRAGTQQIQANRFIDKSKALASERQVSTTIASFLPTGLMRRITPTRSTRPSARG